MGCGQTSHSTDGRVTQLLWRGGIDSFGGHETPKKTRTGHTWSSKQGSTKATKGLGILGHQNFIERLESQTTLVLLKGSKELYHATKPDSTLL